MIGLLIASLDIVGIWARPGIKGGNSAVYMIIKNNDTLPDTLYKAESKICNRVELHKSYQDEKGRMGMKKVDFIVIPPKGEFRFESGGYHFMLINLKRPIKGGNKFKMSLYFKRNGKVDIDVEVK